MRRRRRKNPLMDFSLFSFILGGAAGALGASWFIKSQSALPPAAPTPQVSTGT